MRMAIYLSSVDFQFKTTLWGPISVIQVLLPSTREINISSVEFWDPNPRAAIYASSKLAIEGVFEALTAELSPFNIRILAIQTCGIKIAFDLRC